MELPVGERKEMVVGIIVVYREIEAGMQKHAGKENAQPWASGLP